MASAKAKTSRPQWLVCDSGAGKTRAMNAAKADHRDQQPQITSTMGVRQWPIDGLLAVCTVMSVPGQFRRQSAPAGEDI